ncbi:tetratricopeptide repeat protein [Sphingomonas sp.]|uniref:tetratricopeptide repeat protein n=1 Tax=Sphingomonas sp. TaxID=28214 RepID=UPI001EB62535|nr:tetratricopeptide repeat protein [Sphingomonas sp.]MBX3593298.1 tetratricopeptide repeat protein [Sphingomonas sp.]
MRITLVSIAGALALLSVSTSLYGQRADDQIDARSVAMLDKGKAARAAGNLEEANGLIESALALDPRNRAAFITLAEIARAQGLPGKAIRLYREALTLEPNDIVALRGQGEAMVQKGAVERAKENLARVKTLCGSCAEATQLAAAIAKGPPATATAQVVPPPKEEKN